jgi:biotin carboxyl carrier protein
VWMKKRYVLNYDDNQHGAVVARQGAETKVRVDDGDMTPVNYRPVLGGKAISIRFGGRIHLVHLSGLGNKGNVVATINGRPVNLTVMDELKAQALDSLGGGAGSGTIAADIPGLVFEIKVKVGQVVHQGDPVVVVEAMKMQNELVAAVGGTVSEIPVEAGQAVNPGDILVVIEPEVGG